MAQLVEHIVHIDGVTGSSPVATTMRTLVNQGFFLFAHTQIPKPHPNDTQLSRFRGQVADEGLHPVGAFATHGRRHMPVAIQRECRGVMPHVFLQGFDVIPRHDAVHGKRVPLWYNRKKRRSPYFTRGCAVCRCEISPFPALKWQRKICPGQEVCYANTKKQAKTGTKRSQK